MAATLDELRRNISILQSKIKSDDWNKSDVLKFLDPLKQGIEAGSLYESIQNESGDRADLWQSDCDVLFQMVVDSNELLRSLYERVSALEKDNLELKEEVRKLKEEVRRLSEKSGIFDEFKNDGLTIMTGQVAIEIEQRILDTVLSDLLTCDQHINTLDDMEKVIQDDDDDDDDVFETDDRRDTARRRWAELKSRFSWKRKHTRYIQELKCKRNPIAHPKVDRRKIGEALKMGTIKVRDQKLFEEFLQIHEQFCGKS